jgi:hypothetical protein
MELAATIIAIKATPPAMRPIVPPVVGFLSARSTPFDSLFITFPCKSKVN